MTKLILFSLILTFAASCGDSKSPETSTNEATSATEEKTAGANPSYDPNRGEGKFTKVELEATLDAAKAVEGKKVSDVKCSSCHKLTDEKLVGPGWKGVTARFTAPWIMNFITNTDEMLTKDPKAQAQLEICLVRMPNQNLSDEDARSLYELMRKNDGVK